MKKYFLAFAIFTNILISSPKPKLVVFISIDQFRYEYLNKFHKYFGKKGFRLLLDKGANLSNSKFLHSSTETGPGHAVLMSGSYGNINGIIANEWYDVLKKQKMYCVEDTIYSTIGTKKTTFRSPRNFSGTTVGDELKLATNFRSKVFSVSIKDRSAILMGGKLADGAYFGADSFFTTSTYYQKQLPEWINNLNNNGFVTKYIGKTWDKILPEKEYSLVGPDDAVGESTPAGGTKTFPHKIENIGSIINSPFGNNLVTDFSLQLIDEEKLGEDEFTDILCVGLSSNDYVGHTFGPNSHEVMDITIRTDKLLEEFFSELDKKIGLQNILIGLSSDHGVADLPETILEKRPMANAGRVPWNILEQATGTVLENKFGKLEQNQKYLLNIAGNNIYLNKEVFTTKNFDFELAMELVKDTLLTFDGIAAAYTKEQLTEGAVSTKIGKQAVFSYHPVRSGDVFFQLSPNYIGTYVPSKQASKALLTKNFSVGASHGEPWDYDAYVPMLFYGVGIKNGNFPMQTSPADIAPTLCYLLGISSTSGNQGNILYQIFK